MRRYIKRTPRKAWPPRKYRGVTYKSEGEYLFITKYHAVGGLPTINKQWEFAKRTLGRRWSVDFVIKSAKLVVEIDGYGHHRAAKALADREKQMELTLMGYHVLRFSTADCRGATALDYVRLFLDKKERKEIC